MDRVTGETSGSSPDPQDVGCPLEMVGIVGQPELMALYFSRLATLRFITEVLARAITQFREEWFVAVPADFLVL